MARCDPRSALDTRAETMRIRTSMLVAALAVFAGCGGTGPGAHGRAIDTRAIDARPIDARPVAAARSHEARRAPRDRTFRHHRRGDWRRRQGSAREVVGDRNPVRGEQRVPPDGGGAARDRRRGCERRSQAARLPRGWRPWLSRLSAPYPYRRLRSSRRSMPTSNATARTPTGSTRLVRTCGRQFS